MAAHMTMAPYVLVVALSAALSAQIDSRLTIPERVKLQAPKPFAQIRVRELLPESVDDVAPKADLIVDGTVEVVGTYLSPDQKDLYTDYLITPRRVVFQRHQEVSSVPGVALPIIVTRWGGRTVIDGVAVDIQDADIRSFRPGEEVFLLLVRDDSGKKCRLVSDIAGAFSVSQDHVDPFVRHPSYARFKGMPLDQLESSVRAAISRR